MLPVSWLYVDGYDGTKSGFATLVKKLKNAPHESLFSTDLVITLVELFWEDYSTNVITLAFLPFIVYLFATLKYFSTYIN